MNNNEYADDELPLPSFVEVFGDGLTLLGSRKKKKSMGSSSSAGKMDGLTGEESTG
jgi:hypothetical protein